MTTRIFTYIVLAIGFLSSMATAEKFPFADGTFNENNKLANWSLEKVRKYRDDTIGKLTNDDNTSKGGAEKDAAADPKKLNGYPSPEKESKIFTTKLDLTDVSGLVYVAIHVDDLAFLTVTEIDDAEKPIGTPITYDLKGSALWRAEISYKEFPNPIPGGKKYSLKLDYTNTVNLTKQYNNGLIDYDGVNVFLIQSCVVLNLEIADGQGGNILTSAEEDNPGAFTVANKNDTDDDRQIDNLDADVPGEVDLMRIVINPPIPNDDTERIVTLAKPLNAKLYKSSDKKAGEESKTTWKAKELPATYWVEMQTASSAIMTEVFTLSGSNAISDSVKATAIWVELDNTYNNGKQMPNELDDLKLKNTAQQLGLGLSYWSGNHPFFVPNVWGAQAGVLYEWKVSPAGLENESKVKFDLSRQAETVSANMAPGQNFIQGPSKVFPAGDIPNDDSGTSSEDEKPLKQHIYHGDWPGALTRPLPPVGTELAARGNLLEYVRVGIGNPNGTRPSTYYDANGAIINPNNVGSRCSAKEKWFFKIWVEMTQNGIQAKTGNSVGMPIRNIVVTGQHSPTNQP